MDKIEREKFKREHLYRPTDRCRVVTRAPTSPAPFVIHLHQLPRNCISTYHLARYNCSTFE